jgi:hypothetical protein
MPLTMPKEIRKLFKSITAHMQNVDELHVTEPARRKTIYQLFERNTNIKKKNVEIKSTLIK